MIFHSSETDGPPCRHMETFLQKTGDGSANGFERWYANAHAARCAHCATFLRRLAETRASLADSREAVPSDVLARLRARIPSSD